MQNIREHFRQILLIAGIVVAVFLLLDYQSRIKQLNEIETQREIVEADVVELRQTKQALEKDLDYAESDAMVEEFAREDLNAGQSGDVRVVPIPVGSVTPTPVPVQVNTQVSVEKWEVWRVLIFKK